LRLFFKMTSDHAVFGLRIFRYKSSGLFFGKNEGSWKEAWLALYDDDTLLWFNDKHCSKVCGRIPNFIATHMPFVIAGRVADTQAQNLRPRRPTYSTAEEALYLAFPKSNGKKNSDMYWFYTKTDSDLLTCLRHFAEAAGRERDFRLFLEQYQIGGSPRILGMGGKYRRFGGSLKGDLKPSMALKEDIGVIWKQFINSPPSAKIENLETVDKNVFVELSSKTVESSIGAIELASSQLVVRPKSTEDSDIFHDVGYCSSRTTESARQSYKDGRSDSETSANGTHFSTTVSVEVHSNNSR